jgi:uncharacterized membrane protein SpoIIM required for sporulation
VSGPRSAAFVRRRLEAWRRFRHDASVLSRQATVPPDAAIPFARRYRDLAADLSAARALRCDPAVVEELNALVALGHSIVYRRRLAPEGPRGPGPWRRAGTLLLTGFPGLLWVHGNAVAAAAAMLLVPAGAGYLWVIDDPGRIGEVLPSLEAVISPNGAGASAVTSTPVTLTSFYWVNNNLAALLCFAAGFAGGIGTGICLSVNGLLLGAMAAHFEAHGALARFWPQILPHGIPELLGIVVAGAAGLLVARAEWRPGEWRRGDAVVRAAREATPLLLGCFALIVAAGIIEGMFTRAVASDGIRNAFAVCIGIATAAWIAAARPRRDPAPAAPPGPTGGRAP